MKLLIAAYPHSVELPISTVFKRVQCFDETPYLPFFPIYFLPVLWLIDFIITVMSLYIKIYQSKGGHVSILQPLFRVDFHNASFKRNLIAEIWAIREDFHHFCEQIIWTIYCEAMTSTHSFAYSYIDCSMFRWKLRKFQISYLPYFLSDLLKIFTVLFEILCSFYWLNSNLDCISPLKMKF